MQQLVPQFILEQMDRERSTGHFHAVSLFVDVSGFTPLATALMEFSTDGAEVIAEVLGTLFEPLIDIIYAHGGFVATFAGDAFTALFPTQPLSPTTSGPAATDSYHRAAAAAWQCNQFVKTNAQQATRFGTFTFAVKVSIADGMVQWGIWQAPATANAGQQQRATYYFIGEAIDQCFQVDAFVPAGGIVLTAAVCAHLSPDLVALDRRAHLQQLVNFARPAISAFGAQSDPPAASGELGGAFFPLDLLQRPRDGEFRQITAMFINLAELPTGQTAVEFKRILFDRLAQYGGYLCSIGRIGRKDRTCTLILFWGAPIGRENDVLRALNFVLDLQQVTTVSMRAGISYHLAYAGFIGSAWRAEYTCYSVHVALAARQMTIAKWGEILLDQQSALQAGSHFHVEHHGQRQFKGFVEELPVFLLQRRRERRRESHDNRAMDAPLFGREDELTRLQQATETIVRGQFGGVVVVSGEAGIGKSRLLREVRHRLNSSSQQTTSADQINGSGAQNLQEPTAVSLPPLWLYCHADEILRQPLNPFRYLLKGYFHQLSSQDLVVNRQQFLQKFTALHAKIQDLPLARELMRLRPMVATLIDLPWEDQLYQQLDPALRLENSLEAIKVVLKAASHQQPLIIQLEDAHWLDHESALFLDKLAHNMEAHPLLLLITTRDTAPAESDNGVGIKAAWTAKPRTVIQLQPLPQQELHALAANQLGGIVTPAMLALLQERAKGNPFFAEQMLLYWQEQELLQWSDEGWQFEEEQEMPFVENPSPLSPDIRTLLTARLDGLPHAMKLVVQIAAVLGYEYEQSVLAHMIEAEVLDADAFGQISDSGIWHVVSPTTYRFHHALLCDTAYGMQSRATLQRLHLRAATAIQAVHAADLQPHYAALVYHYYKADQPAEECHYGYLAGNYAVQNYLNEEAIRYYNRALTLAAADDLEERYAISVAREAAHQWLGNHQRQLNDILLQLSLAAAADNRDWQIEATIKQADYERIMGNYDAAVANSKVAVALARELKLLTLQGQAHYIWGRALRHQGEHRQAHQQLQQALSAARQTDNRLLEANCLHEFGHFAYVQGTYEEATAYYSQAEAIYQQTNDKKGQVNCLLMFGAIYYGRGIFTEAEQLFQRALIITRKLGWHPGETTCLSNLGNTYFDVGDYTKAGAYHLEALHLCREINDREGEAVSLDTLGLIAHSHHELDSAEQYYAQALAIQQELGDQHGEAYTQTHWGYTLLAKAAWEQAHACFQAALTIRQKLGAESAAVDSLTGLAFIEWQADQASSSLAMALSIVEQIEANGTDGLEFPVQVYLLCYQIIHESLTTHPEHREVAHRTLRAAHHLIQQRAMQITDPELRQLFLTGVASNIKVLELWRLEQPTAAPL